MNVTARSALRISDYTGAFAGFAVGSAMLWLGPAAFPATVAVRAPFFGVAGGAVAALALAFAATGLFDASQAARRALRWTYAASLVAAGILLFPAAPFFAIVLAAIGCGVAVLPLSRWVPLGWPCAWSRSLRAILGRRIAFVAFAALWVWASSAVLLLHHDAAVDAAHADLETINRAWFELRSLGRTMQALAEIDPSGQPDHVFTVLRYGDAPVLWVEHVAADGHVVEAWPPAAVEQAPKAALAAAGTAAARAQTTNDVASSPFFTPTSAGGVGVAAAQPLPDARLGSVVAIYDVDELLATIARLNVTPAVALTIDDGRRGMPVPSRNDVTEERSFLIPGSGQPWRIRAAYSATQLSVTTEHSIAMILAALLLATAAIVWMSAKFADAIARPIREIREHAGRLAGGEVFESVPADSEELADLAATLETVGTAIHSRDRALTLAHDLTLGTFGLRETEVVREMAEAAVASYCGERGCARIVEQKPDAATDGAALEWPRPVSTMVIRYPLRAAGATLEVRLPHAIPEDDLASLALLADTADLAIGASALLRTLGEERSLLDHIYASVPVGIVLTDQAGHVALANEAARDLLDASTPHEVIGQPLAAQLGTEELHDGRVLVGQRQRPVEVLVRRAIGGARMLVLLRDLTEQEAIEGLKSEFMAAVSHDLRTPLTAIKGFAVLLQERGDLDGTVREILMLIDRAANRLTRMIDDLMQSALLESGRLTLISEPIPLGSAVRGLSLLEAESPSHELLLEVPPQLDVFADRDRLEQVLANLVSNAFKYAPKGRVLVRARAVGDRAEIVVSDDGPGIPLEEQERIFEKFYQAPVQGKKRRGVGLGLYISRELIERMGGTLTVRSVPGFGATFAISLRAAKLGTHVERSA